MVTMNYLIAILVILSGVLIVALYLQSPLISIGNTQQRAEIKSELYFSDKLVLNQPTTLTLYLVSAKNETNVTAEIILPEGLELVNGDLSWSGDLTGNQTMVIRAIVIPVKEGDFTVNTILAGENEPVIKSSIVNVTRSDVPPPTEMTTVKYPPAPYWIIGKANDYMISLLGEDYFYNNITFVAGFFKGPGYYAVEYRHPKIDFIQVRLDSHGNVTYYRGPTRPYSFNLTEEQAIEIAKNYGMMEPIEAKVVYGGDGFQADGGSIYESYMWHLYSKSYRSGRPNIVYVDVDTGDILGVMRFPGKIKPIFGPSDIPFYLNFTGIPDEIVINNITNISFEISSLVNVSNLTIYIDVNPAFEVLTGNGNLSYDDISWHGNILANRRNWLNVTIKNIKQGVWDIEGYVYHLTNDMLLGNFTAKSIRIVPPEAIPPYQCPNVTSIGCMPAVPHEGLIYCAGDWARWIRENCNITIDS